MGRRYAILDVFTNTALSGNPLAVVLDSEGLSDAQMQSIAGEFNLSETVFVLPAEKIGAVRCAVILRENAAGFAEFDVPKLPEHAGPTQDNELIAEALGLDPTDIGFENHKPSRFKVGPAFNFIPVRDLDALARAKPNLQRWSAAFDQDEHNDAYVYCRETRSHDSAFQARLFAPEMGIPEDPATGSAASAFAGAIHYFDRLPGGSHVFRIEQGFVMGRPSLIDLEIDVEDKQLHAVRVGGQATIVARGELFI